MGRLTKKILIGWTLEGLGGADCRRHCDKNTDCLKCEIKKAFKKLAHYEDMEEQGQLVLYPREAYFIKNKKVHKGWVQEANYFVSRKPLYDIRYDDYSLDSYRGYLGNTVFLTKEEAEVRLEELEGE